MKLFGAGKLKEKNKDKESESESIERLQRAEMEAAAEGVSLRANSFRTGPLEAEIICHILIFVLIISNMFYSHAPSKGIKLSPSVCHITFSFYYRYLGCIDI